jgi:hypothetical protein
MTRPDAHHDEVLTYDTATPQQVAEARAEARRKLAKADAHWTPERREQARREFFARLNVA